jgi:hypothetical protein
MKKLITSFVMLLGAGNVYALPACPTTGYFDNCFGPYTYEDGDKYDGEWKGDKMHGHGSYLAPDGDQYVGEFRYNYFHGYGVIDLTNGNRYVGQWKNDKFNGQGTYTWSGGTKFVGEFKDGLFHGQGTYTQTNGDEYVGQWKNDKFNGQGTYTWSGGTKFVGEFKDGLFHGQGTYTQTNGDQYIGQFNDDVLEGQGTYTWNDGDIFIGEFKDWDNWEGVQYSSSGKLVGTYSKGEFCNDCEPTGRHLALIREIDPSHAKFSNQWCARHPDSFACSELVSDSDSYLQLSSTGTGFVVNPNYVVTADHVLEECSAVKIVHANQKITAQTVGRSRSNDLGLLHFDQQFLHAASLRGGRSVRLGERVSNYGYPLFGDFSNSATITEGNINNLFGWGNDSTVMQFDAPTQPGNSGGPVLDSSGNVAGVAISTLSKEYADATGHIAQNVNFAVKSTIVEDFLKTYNVSFERAESTERLDLPDLAEKAETFTVLVECWK